MIDKHDDYIDSMRFGPEYSWIQPPAYLGAVRGLGYGDVIAELIVEDVPKAPDLPRFNLSPY